MACFGLLLGTVGIDNMTGHFRYSFDIAELGDGLGIVPVAVGLFGLGEILSTPTARAVRGVVAPRLRELMGGDVFYYHGYVELQLDGRWVKATPAFDLALCERVIADCFASQDYIEGRRAFMEKRRPAFTGK